ncbi:hypothetical protein GCM10025791_17530 [Halioxenophilus aromaticivorans]|uniref:SGNH domain-containing protein n=2 Tax=Halioxenophilus aromaticivorans TaxID=1306992 RepID=A0AAV3U112_9ALTE
MPHVGNGFCFYSFNDKAGLPVTLIDPPPCFIGVEQSSLSRALAFGDSFLGQYDPFLNNLFKDLGVRVQSVSTNWCFPSFEDDFTGPETHPSYEQCLVNRRFLRQIIDGRKIDKLFLAGSWNSVYKAGYIGQVAELIKEASSVGVSVVVLPAPQPYTSQAIAGYQKYILESNNESFDITEFEKLLADVGGDALSAQVGTTSNVTFINREDLFAGSGVFRKGGILVPYTLDGSHISLVGAEAIYSHFSRTKTYVEIKQMFESVATK